MIMDIVCSILANENSSKVIYDVLNKFLPNYEKLNLDYTNPPNDENYEFKSEDEMLNYFVEHKEFAQTFYWNKYQDNPGKIMVGANITDDDKLIMSLTFNGTNETEQKYYLELKSILNSEIGVISYVNPAEFENGEDFKLRYRNIKYEFEKK